MSSLWPGLSRPSCESGVIGMVVTRCSILSDQGCLKREDKSSARLIDK